MILKIKQLTVKQVKSKLGGEGLGLAVGPFSVIIHSSLDSIAQGVSILYNDFEVIEKQNFFDFHIKVDSPGSVRRWLRKQVVFSIDEYRPFKPLPQAHALPVLEWGLNWCIANHAHQYLMLHSAVIEKNNTTILLPGQPGSGKSTLCAGLVSRGWRLLSDEMALIDLSSLTVSPNPRPISLKNKSIDVIGQFAPELSIGPHAYGTDKGTVAHVVPPWSSIERQHELAPPISRIVFPKYKAGSQSSLVQLKETDTIMQLIEGTFNYNALGEKGFLAITDVVSNSKCQKFTYSSLDDAITVFEDFTN